MEHFAKKFANFNSPPSYLFTKVYKQNAEARLSGRRLSNPLILNELHALFGKKESNKKHPLFYNSS